MAKFQLDITKLKMAELWKKAFNKEFKVNVPVSDLTSSTSKKRSSLEKKSHIESNFVMVEPNLFPSLDPREQKIVIKLMSELKERNALWYFDYREKGRDERAILTLRKKEILFKTDVNEIHIVNPWFIRRGTIEVVIVATNKVISEGKLSKKMIKHLLNPKEANLHSIYDIATD